MTAAIELFTYTNNHVRVLRDDEGEPLFVLADLCRVLGIANSGNVAARLPHDVKGFRLADTPGGQQSMQVVSESGMYEVVIRSDKPDAIDFRRWITSEVLPQIRKTGTYGRLPAQPTALPSKKELAQWLIEAEDARELAEARVAELEPPAAAWTELAEAAGDYSVADAAKVLSRSPIGSIGQNRLFGAMQGFGWAYWQGGRWHAMQRAVDYGWLVEKVGKPYYHAGRDEVVAADPVIRITPKGLGALQKRLGGGSGQLALAVSV